MQRGDPQAALAWMNNLIASIRTSRGRGDAARYRCGFHDCRTGNWNVEYVVGCFDLTEEVLTINLFETDLGFVRRNGFDISCKNYRDSTIFDTAEDEHPSDW